MSSEKTITDLDNLLASWITDHLSVYHTMDPDVRVYPISKSVRSVLHREETTQNVEDHKPTRDSRPLLDKETNIMSYRELDHLRESCCFPAGVQVRLPKVGETVMSARPSEVAFYEVAFSAGLRLPIPTLRKVLNFYNICLAQMVPNGWKSIALVIGRQYPLSE